MVGHGGLLKYLETRGSEKMAKSAGASDSLIGRKSSLSVRKLI